MFSSFVKIRSKQLGCCPSLKRVGTLTCWNKKLYYESIVNDLDAIDWDNVLDDQSADEMWNTFKSKLYKSMDKTHS
jgi:hypothetical protein